MELSVICVGEYMTNCWLLNDKKSGKSLLIDPGYYSVELDFFLKKNGISELEYILITHGHIDHICGVSHIKKKYGGKIVIGEKDAHLLEKNDIIVNTPAYESSFLPCKADITVKDGDELDFAGEKIKVIFTPGHTPGEVCYIIGDKLFSGDLLFRGSMGRTDLKGGDFFRVVQSLKVLSALDKDYVVLPGHGEKTTLNYEKATNRYLKAAAGINDT